MQESDLYSLEIRIEEGFLSMGQDFPSFPLLLRIKFWQHKLPPKMVLLGGETAWRQRSEELVKIFLFCPWVYFI